jgi:hypothetical protein
MNKVQKPVSNTKIKKKNRAAHIDEEPNLRRIDSQLNQLRIDLIMKSKKVEKHSVPRVDKIPLYYINEITDERGFNMQMKKEKNMEENYEKLREKQRPLVKAIIRLQNTELHEISKQNCGNFNA